MDRSKAIPEAVGAGNQEGCRRNVEHKGHDVVVVTTIVQTFESILHHVHLSGGRGILEYHVVALVVQGKVALLP